MMKLLRFFIVLSFFFLSEVGVLSAQTKELPMEVRVMRAVIIDMEMDFAVGFNEKRRGVISVGPTISEADQENGLRPAVVRVTGGGAEALIDVETNNITIDADADNDFVEVYDFDIINKGTGASVIVIPDSNEDSFLLSVGAKVDGLSKNEFFSSVNIININYL